MRLEPVADPGLGRSLGYPAAALGATVAFAMALALVAGAAWRWNCRQASSQGRPQ